jgi:FkbM family methyltransferase
MPPPDHQPEVTSAPGWRLPAPVRRLVRRSLRAGLRLARRGPFARRLSHIPFRPIADRWCAGREIVTWRGVRVAVDPGEAHGFHVYFLGDYGGAEIDACIALAREARWFADVGANIGLVTLAVARAVPSLRVVAVEPDRAVCEWLRLNLSLNPDLAARVEVLEAAATDHDGEVTFLPSRSSLNAGVGRVADRATSATVTVRGVSLGALADRRSRPFDVVKIDVEGAERLALAGVLQTAVPPLGLVIETHAFTSADPEAFNRDLFTLLSTHGYRIERLHRGHWHPITSPSDIGPRGHLRACQKRNHEEHEGPSAVEPQPM